MQAPRSKFQLGQVVSTPGALEQAGSIDELVPLLYRHATGDWGDLDEEDKDANDRAVKYDNDRILSAYDTPRGRFWIITEADRSVTTVLLPEEY
jgi:hypothetical protein